MNSIQNNRHTYLSNYFHLKNTEKSIDKLNSATLRKLHSAQLPDFEQTKILTRTPAEISEEEFIEKIEQMARQDYANGDWASTNPQYMILKRSYVQVASPDRKSLFAQALSVWKLGPNNGQKWDTGVYDSFGNMVGLYDISTRQWHSTGTPAEAARESVFDAIYINAWRQAKAEAEGS